MQTANPPIDFIEPMLQLVAWEVTRRCNLFCAHCRASAAGSQPEGELSTAECFTVVDQILEAGSPILILTGGEPLLRPDIFDIAEYAAGKGLRVVMGSNGTLITPETAARLKSVPVSRVSVSLDFPSAEMQDRFRGQQGAFDAALGGIRALRGAGIDVQVNSTLTKMNLSFLDDLLSLALGEGAVAFHPFFLVPTGRGKGLGKDELDAAEYESALIWIYQRQLELGNRIFFKPTDAPHYLRVIKQKQNEGGQPPADQSRLRGQPGTAHSLTRGCLAGTGFCFISHRGKVQGCGYLEVEAGNVRKETFSRVWKNSPLFNNLRNLSLLRGKCGICEYKRICGGCRARAYENSGDYMQEEPYCLYQPGMSKVAANNA